MESTEFQNLVQNIRIIDQQFRDFPRADSSTPENQRKLRACISLVHSELETYFELISIKVIDSYQANRLNKKQRAKLKFSIALYNHQSYEGKADDQLVRVDSSINAYKSTIAKNNGIKEKDILKILLPLSIPLSRIDTTWLTSINSFGSLRGELIHKNLNQITRLIGHQYLDETVYRIIIPGIDKIDKYLTSNFNLA